MSCGVLKREEAQRLAKKIGSPDLICPNADNRKVYENYYRIYRQLYEQTKESAHRLGEEG